MYVHVCIRMMFLLFNLGSSLCSICPCRLTSTEELVVATQTLLTLLGNALDHPEDMKFRKVKLSNATLQSRLLSKPGGLDALKYGLIVLFFGICCDL